jgi:taurine dioxygenase
MKLVPTGAALGVEATEVDLREPLGEADRAALRGALLSHGVVFLRGQKLSARQFVDAARIFGEIEMYDSTLKKFLLPEQPEVIVLSNIVEDGKPIGIVDAGTYWHTDRSYVKKPAWSSCLHALEVPHAEDGTPLGDTEFASMPKAYAGLDPALKERLRGLSAWHEYVFRFSEKNDAMPGVTHPIVLEHPVTKQACLYVNKGFTHRIPDLQGDEGKALLEQLFEHAHQPEFIYRHRWQVGDVLLWDNYSTQHNATGGYALPQRRHMWRTTIQGFALG